MALETDRSRWHRLPEKDQHQSVVGICEWLWRDQEPVRKRMLEQLRWYEGLHIPGLSADAYNQRTILRAGTEGEEVHWNVPRALVQSVVAKIAGRQRPKPSLVCTDADWATKRRAKRLEHFVEATMHQPQGMFRDSWDAATAGFVDCAVFGLGALKVFPDFVTERIGVDRLLPWELLFDPLEATYGNPLNGFHRFAYDKDRLIAAFPQHRDAIHVAKDDEPASWGSKLRIARRCTVYEAWRLPCGPKDKGVHSICINKKTLFSEEWTRDEFPFLIFRWARHLLGYGGTSLVEEAIPTANELNFTIEKMREGERKLAVGGIVYPQDAVDEEKLKGSRVGMMIPLKPGHVATEVNVLQPQGYSESTLNWMRLHWDKSFEFTGVSQMAATSRKEPGVTAGVALRALANMETERFSLVYTAFEQACAVDMTRHMIACARDVAEETKGFRVKWPGAGYLREISWKDADLEDAQYQIQAEALPGIANTPADRLQLGQDLFNAGIIGADAFVRIIQLGKDVETELRGRNVQRDLIERYIETWLDATPEDEESGRFVFRGPIPFMKLPDAIIQVGDAYMQAELDGAPDYNLQFFTTFLTAASDLIARANAQQAQMGAPPPAPQPGQGLPGNAPLPPAQAGPAKVLN